MSGRRDVEGGQRRTGKTGCAALRQRQADGAPIPGGSGLSLRAGRVGCCNAGDVIGCLAVEHGGGAGDHVSFLGRCFQALEIEFGGGQLRPLRGRAITLRIARSISGQWIAMRLPRLVSLQWQLLKLERCPHFPIVECVELIGRQLDEGQKIARFSGQQVKPNSHECLSRLTDELLCRD